MSSPPSPSTALCPSLSLTAPTRSCTVAIDSDALKKDSSRPVDKLAVSRLFPYSSWRHRKMKEVMSILDDDMTQSRKALEGLDLRSLVS